MPNRLPNNANRFGPLIGVSGRGGGALTSGGRTAATRAALSSATPDSVPASASLVRFVSSVAGLPGLVHGG